MAQTEQFTPGPWRSEQDGSLGRHTIFADDQHDVEHFAVARDVEPEDAPIIAAAPDLLDALQTLRAMVDQRWPGADLSRSSWAAPCAQADAAIARATGSSS